MIVDPIMQEVRAIREAIAAESNYDLDAIFEVFRRLEATSGRPYVAPPAQSTGSPAVATEEDAAQQGNAAAGRSARG